MKHLFVILIFAATAVSADTNRITSAFTEGLAVFERDGRFGFIETNGVVVIQNRFYVATPFTNGLAAVKTGVQSWGYIDRTGTLVIDDKYAIATPFKNGVATVGVQGLWNKLTARIFDTQAKVKYHQIDTKGQRIPDNPKEESTASHPIAAGAAQAERHVRIKKMKRSVIIVAVFIALWALLGLTAKDVYDRFLPGVPDGGRWPISSLPWLLARANTPGRPWNDLHHAIVWSLAVVTLLAPIAFVLAAARTKAQRIVAWAASGILTAWALFTVFRVQYEYVTILKWPPTKMAAVWFIVEPMLWAGVICALGLAVGEMIKQITNANNELESIVA